MLYRVPPDAGYGRNCDGVEDAAKLAEMLLAEDCRVAGGDYLRPAYPTRAGTLCTPDEPDL